MYVLHFKPSDYEGIDFDKVKKLLNSNYLIDINIDLKESLEEQMVEDIEDIAERHIDGKEYKTLEDVLNDEDKMYLIKYEAKKTSLDKIRKSLNKYLDTLKNIVNTKMYFND